jgi:hypothetical protein
MTDGARVTLGAAAGAMTVALIMPLTSPLFRPPTGGIGFVTVHSYAKSYDYALMLLLVAGAFVGGLAAGWTKRHGEPAGLSDMGTPRRVPAFVGSLVVFVLMLFIHDHPYVLMDPFHEGEHLTPAFLLTSGERPYSDFFVLHGLGADGALDALFLGDPPSPHRTRRVETFLDAATLALLVPIAAEVCATPPGVAIAVFASLCAVAAGQLPVFPYYRLAPMLLATLALLRYVRRGGAGALFVAFSASTLGILWSLDTGSYALAATAVIFGAVRITKSEAAPLSTGRVLLIAAIALAMPFAILLALGAGVRQFLVDSFVIIPGSIDAVWSLPAPPAPTLRELWRWFDSESARFYLPPAINGAFIALAVHLYRRGERAAAARVFVVAVASLLVFRTATGRVAWSHTRYGVPLFGIAVVAFVVEPLWRTRRRVLSVAAAVLLAVLVEPRANVIAGAKLLSGWHGRQSHAGLVAYPFKTGKGIYTTAENAADLAALNGFVESVAAPGATILDFSNERALYYLLQRKPPVRCFDIPMLSAPALRTEAMRQLDEHPPACVILKGIEALGSFDGVPNDVRVPELARWIDAHYPRRVQIGRFVVAAP